MWSNWKSRTLLVAKQNGMSTLENRVTVSDNIKRTPHSYPIPGCVSERKTSTQSTHKCFLVKPQTVLAGGKADTVGKGRSLGVTFWWQEIGCPSHGHSWGPVSCENRAARWLCKQMLTSVALSLPPPDSSWSTSSGPLLFSGSLTSLKA